MAEICSECNTEMVDEGFDQWRCPKYGWVTIHHEEEDDYDELYEEKPECCIACDGDTYPDCMGGCPLIDE